MNKTLFGLLIFLNIVLLTLNSWMLYKQHEERNLWLHHMASMQTKMEKNAESLEAQVNSLGGRAAKTVKNVSSISSQAVDQVKPKLEKTAEELRQTGEELKKTTSESAILLSDNAHKAAEELKMAGQQILSRINNELENFNENMKKTSGANDSSSDGLENSQGNA